MNILAFREQTFHLMPFECHFLAALMTLAGQTDARMWALGSPPDAFIRFSQRPLGQAATLPMPTCGCVLAKWDGWDRHPLKQKSKSLAHTRADERAPPELSHTLHHVIDLVLIRPRHTHVAPLLRPCVLVRKIPNDFCFLPSLFYDSFIFLVKRLCRQACHLTFISLFLHLSL